MLRRVGALLRYSIMAERSWMTAKEWREVVGGVQCAISTEHRGCERSLAKPETVQQFGADGPSKGEGRSDRCAPMRRSIFLVQGLR